MVSNSGLHMHLHVHIHNIHYILCTHTNCSKCLLGRQGKDPKFEVSLGPVIICQETAESGGGESIFKASKLEIIE